jgi:hypothetical protein
MASRDLVTFENGTYKRRPSSSETIDFTSVRIGADNLAITEVDANSFGFASKKLSNVADAVAGTDVPNLAQVQSLVVSGASVKEQLLTQQQLDDTLGIIGGTVLLISANATANDVFTLVNEDATSESWTFVASRSGANEVTIGATAADSMANLATAIITDSSNWKAYYDADSLDSMYADGLVGVYHSAALKDFYCYITQTGGTLAGSVANYSGEIQYMSDPSYIISIPTSDPGASTVYSGFKEAKANLVNGELHNVLAEDKLYSYDGDANGGAGEWYIMAEGAIPVATSGSGGGLLGKVSADEDEGLTITSGVMKAKVDASTIDFDGSGNLYVPSEGITATELAGAVSGDGLTGGNGSALAVGAGNGISVAADAVSVAADSTGGANLATVVSVSANGVAIAIDDNSIGENGSNQLYVKADGISETEIVSTALGNGLTGGSATVISVLADTTGGANLAKVVSVTANGVAIAIDDSSIGENGSNQLYVKADGISETEIVSSALGNGLTGGSATVISVQADSTGGANLATVVSVTANGVAVAIDDSTIGENASNQLEVKSAGITETHLNPTVAGAGLAGGNGTPLSVNVDDSTVEVNVDTLRVKALGITDQEIADDAVNAIKINADVAGDGLGQNGTTGALEVNVGDGMQILSDAVAADYTDTFTNDNAGAVTVRQVVYVKANGNVDLAQATVSSLYDFELGLVADASIASAAAGAVTVRRGAIVGGFSGLTAGLKYYVDRATAGAIVSSLSGWQAGEHVYEIGRAISATEIAFNPRYVIEY